MGGLGLFKTWGADFFCDLDVGTYIFYEIVPIETSNISFEGTQNMQQYGTKITCTDARRKKLILKFVLKNWDCGEGRLTSLMQPRAKLTLG